MKKIEFIAKKTGLSSKEINRFSKLSVLGFIAILITAVMGCVKNNNIEKPASQGMSAEEIKNVANETKVEKKPTEKKIEFDKTENCGPYPGYPCGTKYFTVAFEDFGEFC